MNRPADRMKEALFGLIRSALPTVDYQALYRARMVRQVGMTVDLLPDDRRLPGMSLVPIRTGIPGAEVEVAPGAFMLLGWDAGDPGRPYALAWEPGSTVVRLTLRGARVELGDGGLTPIVDGVVTGRAVDSLTGLPQWMLGNASAVVGARK